MIRVVQVFVLLSCNAIEAGDGGGKVEGVYKTRLRAYAAAEKANEGSLIFREVEDEKGHAWESWDESDEEANYYRVEMQEVR